MTARLHTEPLGTCLLALGPGGLAASDLAAALWPEVREPVMNRFADAGLPPPAPLTAAGLATGPGAWPFLEDRRRALATAPFISVVICTRDRPESAGDLPALASGSRSIRVSKSWWSTTRPPPRRSGLWSSAGLHRIPLRYVREPRPGLSWARNAGAAAASGEIIAYLDDDEEPDRHWLAGLAAGFSRGRDIGCVSGVVLPARLDTPAQEWFEELGGHSKGRGFSRAIFAAAARRARSSRCPPSGSAPTWPSAGTPWPPSGRLMSLLARVRPRAPVRTPSP